jgi:phytoene dehydrogenase-like protein
MSVKRRVGVIGAGVAGLSAAYHLRDDAEITLFESTDRVGGHAHTVCVSEGERELGIDTAFVVFNGRTYPQLTRFFDDLGVGVCDHEGGFNFFDFDSDLQYGSAEMELPEREIAARYPAEFLTLWRDAERFHRDAPRDFLRRRAEVSLGEYLDANGYSDKFRYCRRGGFMPDVPFNPLEFGMPPNTLEVTDVLQLLSLVVAREVLDDAGATGGAWYDPSRTGVVLGITGANQLTQPLSARLQTPVIK